MSLLGIRSIPLSKATREAWTSADLMLIPRQYLDNISIRNFISAHSDEALINMGNTLLNLEELPLPLFNSVETIRAVSLPTALRRTLPDFIPPKVTTGPHWHKYGGFGGSGTVFHENFLGWCEEGQGDVQQHIDGTEYRIITVGNRVVQASKKGNLRWIEGKHVFDWNWVGVSGINSLGIIPHVKQATQAIPNWQHSVLGWDIIDTGGSTFTIEINTSPGVNIPTASRIVKAVRNIISGKEIQINE